MLKKFEVLRFCSFGNLNSYSFNTRIFKSPFVKCFLTAIDSDDSGNWVDAHEEDMENFSRENSVMIKNSVSLKQTPPLGRFDDKKRLRKYSSLLHDCVSQRRLFKQGKSIHGNLIRFQIELDSFLWVSLLDFYAKSEELDYAHKVFVLMPDRDVVSWTALMLGFVAKGFGFDGAILFREMRRDGIRPNEFALPIGLKACSMYKDLKLGEQIHVEGIKLGFSIDSYFRSHLVDVYVKCSKMEFSKRVFLEMPEINVVVGNNLINGYAEIGEGEEVLRLFHVNRNREIFVLNRYTLSKVLKVCASSGNARVGKAVHCVTIRNCYELDDYSCCALIDMYSKTGFENKALTVFKRTQYPDVATWSSVIACFAQKEKAMEMVSLFKEMMYSDVSPNEFTFATVLSALSNTNGEQFGQNIHACVLKQGFVSDTWVSNALVTMYLRNGYLKHGALVFEEMEVRDSVSWNVFLGQYQRSDHVPKLFKLMLAHSFLPTVCTFIEILTSCSSHFKLGLGKQVHAHVIKSSVSNNSNVLTALSDMYVETKCFEDAEICFDKVAIKDHHCWTVMMKGYRENGKPEKAIMCFNEMQRKGIKPNEFTLSSYLDACSTMKTLQAGRSVHSMAFKSGFLDDIFICSSLIDMYGKCGCIKDGERVFQGMLFCDIVTWNALICVYVRYGLGSKALEAFFMMLEDGISPDEITVNKVMLACDDVDLSDQVRLQFRSFQELYGMIPAI